MEILALIIGIIVIGAASRQLIFTIKRTRRRDYYRNVYLKSDAWKRKRYVVLKRDNWSCVYCGKRATQVHHKKYAKHNIGKEPIEWLESVCRSCHDSHHH
jgi:5-methylcytosine-specific restriction endonuclease McrA